MLYSGFLANVNSKILYQVYLLTGKNSLILDDSMLLMEHKVRQKYREQKRQFSKAVFHMDRMRDDKETLFMDVSVTYVVYHWSDGVLNSAETQAFLSLLKEAKDRTSVILHTGDDKLPKMFRELFEVRKKGQIVRCVPPLGRKSRSQVIMNQFGVTNAETFQEVTDVLLDFPLEVVFNIARIMRCLGVEEVTYDLLEDLELLREGIEYIVVKQLLEEGKSVVIRRSDIHKVRSSKFLGLLKERLVTLIRVKGVEDKTLVQGSTILEMDYIVLKNLRKLAERFQLSELYKKLRLVLNLMPIANHDATYLVLLHYW